MTNDDQLQSKDSQAEKIHQETGAALDIIAKAGYMSEVEKDVEFIQNGGVSLMKTECRLLEGLTNWCDCAIQIAVFRGKRPTFHMEIGRKESNRYRHQRNFDYLRKAKI